jgi:hypothetical protein
VAGVALDPQQHRRSPSVAPGVLDLGHGELARVHRVDPVVGVRGDSMSSAG